MEQGGGAFDIDVPAELPLVGLDESQMRQALLNLLRNAREAGGERVRLMARPAEGGVEVSVEDDGAGIPPADRARIFDLFFTTKKNGTGLGLPLTQQIVVAHGGTIRCVPPEGGPGTRFVLWWPAWSEPEA